MVCTGLGPVVGVKLVWAGEKLVWHAWASGRGEELHLGGAEMDRKPAGVEVVDVTCPSAIP